MVNSDGLDNLLIKIGTGRWNYLFFATSTMVPALLPVYLIGSEFMNPDPRFTCVLPDDNHYKVANWSECFMIEEMNGQTKILPCKMWTYDTSVFISTISMEWDLICDRAWLSPWFQTIYTAGNFLGAGLGAVVADKYGRRSAVRAGCMLTISATVAMLFVPWISLILFTRCLLGIFVSMMVCPAFILAMEVCKPSLRTTVGVLIALPYALMMIILSGIAYLLPNWRWIQVIGAIPCLILMALASLTDESPRWLMVHGHREEALKTFQRGVRINRTKLPHDFDLGSVVDSIHRKLTTSTSLKTLQGDDISRDGMAEGSASLGAKDGYTGLSRPGFALGLEDGFGPWWASPVALFRTAVMRKRMLVLLCVRMMMAMVYLGLPLNSGAFSSPFLYMALMGLVELPAYTLPAPVTRVLGRKKVVSLSMMACGIFLLVHIIAKEFGVAQEWFHLSLVLIGYLLVCAAYQVNFLFTPELLPTTLRSWGISACMFAGYIGFSIAPFITDSPSSRLRHLSPAIFGSSGVIAGFLVFLLPETNRRDLPETVRDLHKRKIKEQTQSVSV